MKSFTDCIENLAQKCRNSYKERLIEENKHFSNIQIGLKESLDNINKELVHIKNWDELIAIKEESPEEKLLMKSKTIKPELKSSKCCFYLFGLIFCFFHLIGIQEGIIILNSLFSEIVDEFKLWLNDTPRKYNFFDKLEINSYKDLPEIDVGMVTSSIGIIILREIGFKKTNSIFQLISSILFLLLFLLFNFHTDNKLLENYSRIEIFVLIISYTILSFLVGCSSTLALKEYISLFSKVYNKDDQEEFGEKILFLIQSGISGYIIILVNRLIFKSFKDNSSKWKLVSIIGINFVSYFLSLIFYLLYSIPIINKKEKFKMNKKDNHIQNKEEYGKQKDHNKEEAQKEEREKKSNEDEKDRENELKIDKKNNNNM